MDYIFESQGTSEILKTKNSVHSDLTGFCSVERRYPDQTITDNFHIVRKLISMEDGEGSCYDLYVIDRHYRIIDKTGPLIKHAAAIEDVICEIDTTTDQRLTDVENALCELDNVISEGGTTV